MAMAARIASRETPRIQVSGGGAVRERQPLVQVLGNQQHAGALFPPLQQQGVDLLGGADVEARGGVGGDDQARPAREFAGENQPLDVAAGEGTRRGPRLRGGDLIFGDQPAGEGGGLPQGEQLAPPQGAGGGSGAG